MDTFPNKLKKMGIEKIETTRQPGVSVTEAIKIVQ